MPLPELPPPDGPMVEIADSAHPQEALWILHTHIYDQLMVTPRLALRSPVADCGDPLSAIRAFLAAERHGREIERGAKVELGALEYAEDRDGGRPVAAGVLRRWTAMDPARLLKRPAGGGGRCTWSSGSCSSCCRR